MGDHPVPIFFAADQISPRRRRKRDPRLPPAGTVLERSYRGQIVRVTVLANGFAYQGKEYASLSAIAQPATGTRWNGFHFFGLRQEWPHE